jgi:tight adherence protein C
VPAEDLRILSRSQGQQASHKLAGALAGVILPPFLVLGLIAAGLDVSVTWGIGLATLCCPVGFFFPDLRAREEAAERRDGFRAALASYLDLVKVLVAGGAHTDGALFQAAQVGDGWQFDELRAAIDWSRVNGHPSWVGFERLSSALNVVELSELAGSISLSDEQGASPAEALSRKAESMTIHQFAEARAKADSATEQMGVPTVLIAMAFVVFLGYPALITVVGLS